MNAGTREKAGYILLAAVILLAIILVMLQAPVPQDVRYHRFADTRTIWSVGNFWNVISNIPFLIVGLLGLYKLVFSSSLRILNALRPAYILFFTGVSLITFGSGYYHLFPDNDSLLWDRLPMTVGFMSFFAILLGEFVSVRFGKSAFFPLVIAGIASVVYWHLTERQGEGDLRFYALVQFTPMLLIPVVLLCFRSRYTHVNGFWYLFIAYAIAKLFEYFDVAVFNLTGLISGHSIKHIVSALGIYILLHSFESREERVR